MPRRNLTFLLIVAAVSWLCYERAGRNRYAGTLTEAMNIINANYIAEVEPRVLFEGAMDGMIGKLDPYSGYTSPEEFSQFQQQLEGEFIGVGIVVDYDAENGRLNVAEALIGKPAYVAGIRAGDTIVAIDGKETKEIPQRDAVKMIRGKEGTTVKLRVVRAGRDQPIDYELQRAPIPLETVLGDARRADGKWIYRLASHPRIGYIRIFDNFGERTADEFREALASYRQPAGQIDGLILDLRYNRGGLLEAARDVCDMLLDHGVIVTTRGRHDRVREQYVAQPGTDLPLEVPLVVLVDRLSASASEIVAAALQDNHRAAVAGQRSWGKGTVQNVIKLEGGRSAIRLTVGSYRRPSGKDIHKWKDAKDSDDWGVRPDAGLEALLTNRQNELIIQARRKRDSKSWDELTATAAPAPGSDAQSAVPPLDDNQPSSTVPPVPTAAPDNDGQAAETDPTVESEAAAAAKKDPATIDPQLHKALEYLQEQISGHAPQPGRA
jgi:carboxyl-terminal processing protease